MKEKINFKKKKMIKKYKKIKNKINLFINSKEKKEIIASFLKKIKNKIKFRKILFIIIALIPFIMMDVVTRLWNAGDNNFTLLNMSSCLFSLSYFILIIGLTLNSNQKYSKIIYFGFYTLFLILFLVNGVYYSSTGNYFEMSMIALAGEGSDYFLDVLKKCNIWVYVFMIVLLIMFFLLYKRFPKKAKYNKRKIIYVVILFLMVNLCARMSLGKANFELTWDSFRKPRNIYNNFNDNKKCMNICGMYEYFSRGFYISYIKPEEKKSETESNFLEDVFSENNDNYVKNSYTGKYKNKNIIMVQLEGIDSWLLNKEVMPYTYSLLNNSINFTNHYSFFNGGGSTFNSEFAVNIGYMTPFTYPQNAYSFNKNDFPYSLANLLKEKNYAINVFHMNNKDYYSRGINYQNFGYDYYYGLADLNVYENHEYYLDRELILNETFNDVLFNQSSNFMHYIITYSNHLPFVSDRGVCSRLIDKEYEKEFSKMNRNQKKEFIANLNLTEEDCIKKQARETDYMVSLLMKELKEHKLYDNTMVVFFADHYLYTASSETLSKYKDLDTNLKNKTPFFIWNANSKPVTVTKVTSQLNILPTVLNLLGVKYNEKWYVMEDALDKKYSGMAIFSDLSWYDGNVYVVDGVVKNKGKISETNLEKKNNYVQYLIKKNDLVLKYNYFKDITR